MARNKEATEDTREACEVHVSGDNLFADLGLPEAEELLFKSDILNNILGIIEDRGLAQRRVAEILGIDQSEVSKLKNCRVRGFSVERLLKFAAALGQDVEITTRRTKGFAPGRLSVTPL